ncbi:isochorismate synthase [Photobacterium rosenbergii]|uniref:isochorismate synthase n=1 Tax=Photobacterium rosenbergii TaxID=294936 RepID=A0ABU3ZMP7_9GAMM|nr:isochorismate synthase [Photobacterium rosenbergii]MDV5171349.1 isochorismate synthase [Photobacterium rosenbergii]
MQHFNAEGEKLSLKSVQPRGFYFSSQERTIIGNGLRHFISIPAQGGEELHSELQKEISRCFKKEIERGVDNPILIGCIPFDVSAPSCLYVPENVTSYSNRPDLNNEPNVLGSINDFGVVSKRSKPNESSFKEAVDKAVGKFKSTELEKAVLSRVLEIELNSDVDVEQILTRLIKQNPKGFHFSIPQPDRSVLVGASPELLIRKEGGSIYSNPLAGSAKRQSNKQQDKITSEKLQGSVKDNYEHRLVIDQIATQLSPYCQTLHVPQQPSLFDTPTMWHLATSIEGELKDAQTNALQLACLLHPTPAVCGYPFNLSHDAIKELEPHDRGMFTGMVGWCDAQGNGEWAVTIRCGKVRDNSVRLFAGAGIVDASCPNAEWAETEAKLGTMLDAFGLKEQEVA